jgi:hypothetical protein
VEADANVNYQEGPMIYLASPYSNDPDGNYQAMLNFCREYFTLLPAPHIFSPVTYYHPIAPALPTMR